MQDFPFSNSSIPGRGRALNSDGGQCAVHELAHLILFMGADEASGFLPVLEEDHGGNAPHLIPNSDIGVHIHVEFQKDSVLPVVLGDLVQYRSHGPAGAAPGRPEVHKDRLFRLEDDVFKLSLGNVAYATAHSASLSQSFANVRQNLVASSDRWSYTFRVDLKSI